MHAPEILATEIFTGEISTTEMSTAEMSTTEFLLLGKSDNLLNMCTIMLKFRILSENKKPSLRTFILSLSTFLLTLSNLSKQKNNSFKYYHTCRKKVFSNSKNGCLFGSDLIFF